MNNELLERLYREYKRLVETLDSTLTLLYELETRVGMLEADRNISHQFRYSEPYIKTDKVMCSSDTEPYDSGVEPYDTVKTVISGSSTNLNGYNTTEHTNNPVNSDPSIKTHTPEEISYWINFGHFEEGE